MPPKFSMQSVLDYRKSRVELLEVNLSRMQQIFNQEKDHLATLFNNLESMYRQLTEEYSKGEVDMVMINQARHNTKFLQTCIASQQIKLQELEKELENLRQEVVHAKQDESVMEKLSEKEAEKYFEKINLQEKQLQDDIYISQARQKLVNKEFPND